MQKNYLPRILLNPFTSQRVFLIGAICLLLNACGGGAGTGACVASVGVLGANACANASSTTTTTTVAQPGLQVGTSLHYTVNENQLLTDVLTAVNTNSTTVTYNLITQSSVSGPKYGTVQITNPATGAFTYTPNPNWYGLDKFSFNITAGGQTSNTGVVYINVVQQYIAPVATSPASVLNVTASASLTGSLTGYVTNVQGNPLIYSSTVQPAHGIINVSNNGNFLYTPNPGYIGSDGFSFTVWDQTANVYSSSTLVSLNITPAVAPTITWNSQGIVGIFNDITAPNISNVNVQLNATCSSGGVVSFQQGNLPLPPGLTISSTGILSGSIPPAPVGFTPTVYEISASATCPGANPTLNVNPIELVVMPPNILYFTNTSTPPTLSTTPPLVQSGCGVAVAGATTIPGITSGTSCTGASLFASVLSTTVTNNGVTTVNYKWTPPGTVLSTMILIVGGGGGGAGANFPVATTCTTTQINGSGGGAGGYIFIPNQSLSSSNPVTIVVGSGGSGGTAGASGSPGSNGSSSSFGLLSALGGIGGKGPGNSGGAEPGTNAIPPFNTVVNAGGSVILGSTTEGGGGGAEGIGMQPGGGLGAPNNITGTSVTYASGGAGGSSLKAPPLPPASFGNDGYGGVGGCGGSAGIAGDPGVVVVRF